MPFVAVVMGSKSDAASIKPALDTLDMLGIDYEVKVISAHRNPERVREYGLAARSNGIEVITTQQITEFRRCFNTGIDALQVLQTVFILIADNFYLCIR